MEQDQDITSLTQLLDRLDEVAQEGERTSVGAIMELASRRFFGSVLLVAGLTTLAPIIGDIPGVPTTIGVLVFAVAIQMLFGRERFWLPRWVLNRSVSSARLHKALTWMRRPARWVDRVVRPRLTFLASGPATYLIALACLLIAAAMPAMELVPFSANAAGAGLTIFGLALIARDGVMALVGFVFIAGVTLGAYHLL